jgi:hypothetical protein
MTLNKYARSHWAVRKRELDLLTQDVHILGNANQIPKARTARTVTITLIKTAQGKRDDPGNLYARSKAILDALVRCELLLDDNNACLTNLVVREERGTSKATRIELEDDE